MPEFLDTQNRKWRIALTVAAMLRWRDDAPGLPDPMNIPATMAILCADPLRAVQASAAVLAPELKTAGITPADFFKAMDGPQAAAAMHALTEEYRRFFVLADQAALVAACLLLEQEKATARRAAISPPPANSGTASGGPPAAPASTPAPGATAT